jgi:hypothetical protein
MFRIRDVHLGSRIRILILVFHPGSRSPDPGVKKAPDPGVKKAPHPGTATFVKSVNIIVHFL